MGKFNKHKKNLVGLFLAIVLFACQNTNQDSEKNTLLAIEKAIIGQKDSFFYINSEEYQISSDLPIGFFDSGTGGLTILNSVLEFDEFNNAKRSFGSDGIPDFANEKFIYLADQANMPYGNYY
ncbi:hypothetical protein MM213_17155, partial [Belliella sp. R4-6]|nr:hypothetical protein [Belliella alkalica]